MYISSFTSMPHHNGHGLEFDSLDEVADAIQKLGELMGEQTPNVDMLINRMRSSIKKGVTYSAFAHAVMRNHPDMSGHTSPSGVVANSSGLVFGGRFFVHNAEGLTQRLPFQHQEIRVDTLVSEGKPDRYLLKVTDNNNPVWRPGLQKPENHTESLLAHELVGERLLKQIRVQVDYVQAARDIEFDFVQLLDALNSIEELERTGLSPDAAAAGYYKYLVECLRSSPE
ncbi:MAG TPA: hypothetical protein VLG40_01345, partial [Candidatus Saccharimonas sp.]|nr:hypothetical protein [Candidatus Saccharimonas sp.]